MRGSGWAISTPAHRNPRHSDGSQFLEARQVSVNANKHKSSSPHVPIRQCVGCRTRAPQRELLRIAQADGTLVIDLPRRLPGRGAYVHRQIACAERATKRGGVFRALRMGAQRAQATALRAQIATLLATESTTIQPKDQ